MSTPCVYLAFLGLHASFVLSNESRVLARTHYRNPLSEHSILLLTGFSFALDKFLDLKYI